MKWSGIITLPLIALLVAGCSDTGTNSRIPLRELTKEEASIVQADNTFGLNLFRQMNDADRHANVFISPLSVSMALGMTLNGAEGSTREGMRTALALQGLTQEEINRSYQSLTELLEGIDPAVTFRIANSIWYRDGLDVEQDFINVNKEYFNAEVTALDFSADNASDRINRWVNDRTNGKISRIIEKIPSDMVMYLINAIYFKGSWTEQFKEENTREADFHLPDGSTVQIPTMMRGDKDFLYFNNGTVQGIDLPYGDVGYSMSIFLPKQGVDVEEIIATLDQERWQQWIGSFQKSEGRLYLPKFTLEYEKTLNAMLKALGMEEAFAPFAANFSGISKTGGLYISEVKHKTFVKVDEEGTEAAAVTSVGVATTSVVTPFEMRVDRPFIVAIREKNSGAILFVGKVSNPGS